MLVPYNPRWSDDFEALKRIVLDVVGPDAVSVDHIGSTAVEGLAAKEVIDLQVAVRQLSVADHWPHRIGPFQRREVRTDHVPAGETPGEEWEKRYWSAGDSGAEAYAAPAWRE